MTKTRYPDLEIYIKAPELDLVADAITAILGPVSWSKNAEPISGPGHNRPGQQCGDPARQGL